MRISPLSNYQSLHTGYNNNKTRLFQGLILWWLIVQQLFFKNWSSGITLVWWQVFKYRVFGGNWYQLFARKKPMNFWLKTTCKLRQMSFSPFWYLVFKKFHNHSVIIHPWRLLRYIIGIYAKYIKNWWLKKIRIIMQISLQQKLGLLLCDLSFLPKWCWRWCFRWCWW